MNIVVHEEAAAELSAAADWYEQKREGLGVDFLSEATRVIEAIAESPNTWPLVYRSKMVRRLLFVRFPYAAYYQVRDQQICVAAFAHTKRKAGYFRHRFDT